MAGKFSGARSEARCEAETSFSSVAFTVLLWAGYYPKSGAEALNIRPDLTVFPQVCTLPSPSTATLPTEGQQEHVLVRKIQKEQISRLAAYRDPGYLQCAICAITISSVSCPA